MVVEKVVVCVFIQLKTETDKKIDEKKV